MNNNVDKFYKITCIVISILLAVLLVGAVLTHVSGLSNSEAKDEPVIENAEIIVEDAEIIEDEPVEKEPIVIEAEIIEEEPETKPVEVIETELVEISSTTIEAESEPVIVDVVDAELLARVIYQEAGADAQCDMCRRRIADVVFNRVESDLFPNTIEEVLTQESQYGMYHWTGVIWPERASDEREANAVARARRIAQEVLSGQHSDLYGNGYIWQAGFTQGNDWVNCCGIYFGR